MPTYRGGANGNAFVSYAAITPFVPGVHEERCPSSPCNRSARVEVGAAKAAPIAKTATAATIILPRYMTPLASVSERKIEEAALRDRNSRRVDTRVVLDRGPRRVNAGVIHDRSPRRVNAGVILDRSPRRVNAGVILDRGPRRVNTGVILDRGPRRVNTRVVPHHELRRMGTQSVGVGRLPPL